MAGVVRYKFRASDHFWKHFDKLTEAQKERARVAFEIFKKDPFDPRLGTHKINALSAAMKRTVYAVQIEGNLRSVYCIEADRLVTFNNGSYDIYRT